MGPGEGKWVDFRSKVASSVLRNKVASSVLRSKVASSVLRAQKMSSPGSRTHGLSKKNLAGVKNQKGEDFSRKVQRKSMQSCLKCWKEHLLRFSLDSEHIEKSREKNVIDRESNLWNIKKKPSRGKKSKERRLFPKSAEKIDAKLLRMRKRTFTAIFVGFWAHGKKLKNVIDREANSSKKNLPGQKIKGRKTFSEKCREFRSKVA